MIEPSTPWAHPGAELFVPDGFPWGAALERTTHLGVGAHQDDLEIMAYHGIRECFQRADRWFCGAIVTDGRNAPRALTYASYSDDEMARLRQAEQKKAAVLGEYGALLLMNHPSQVAKDSSSEDVGADLDALLARTLPEVVYTHNLADKHDTHVAVALRVLSAIRRMPKSVRPKRVIGCEVWRDLDWLSDADKVAMATGGHPGLGRALLGAFQSQIGGGKRYDLAAEGRRMAHATFFEGEKVDGHEALIWGIDLTPLTEDGAGDPFVYVKQHIDRFAEDVRERIARVR